MYIVHTCMLHCAYMYMYSTYECCTWYAGNALVTVATGVLSEDDAERAGLVPTHAYAVLKMVDTEVHMCM